MPDAPLMLTVSGLRGLVGRSLTPPVAANYAAAFAHWVAAHARPGRDPGAAPHVVVGRDSRPSGEMVELAVCAGLLAAGCRVTSLGIVTTPTTAVMVDHLHADAGMVITASHNPIIWNGIKALRYDATAPPPQEARQIIETYNAGRFEYAPVERLAALAHDDIASQVHVDRVLAQVDAAGIRRRRIKVVLDSVHGAGGPPGARLLGALGVDLVHLYAQTTGRFPHEPEPTRANLGGLCDAVRQHRADIGFAQDPDADRLAIVDERGEYLGEEYTLALGVLHVLSTATGPQGIAANLSTSRMIDDIAAMGITGAAAPKPEIRNPKSETSVYRTPVGEANVAAAMHAHRCIIGGEGNGGVIYPPVCMVRDSLIAMALTLELLARRGQPLSQIVAGIPAYAIVKDKVDLPPGGAQDIAPRLRRHFATQAIDGQDGVRVDWPDRWVHVRPSNTEPIMRIIAEAREPATAQALIHEVRTLLGL